MCVKLVKYADKAEACEGEKEQQKKELDEQLKKNEECEGEKEALKSKIEELEEQEEKGNGGIKYA